MDAMPQGGGLILRGQLTSAHVRLEDSDTGVGIPGEQKIFAPLYTTKPGGTELGLYLIRESVTAHGREITVQSDVGQGTTFRMTLPRLETTG